MKLVYPDIKYVLELTENKVNVIVLENSRFFTRIVMELSEQVEEGNGKFVLSEGEKQILLNKIMEVVINPFELDVNQRKVVSRLYVNMVEEINNSEMYLRTNEIKSLVSKYMEYLTEQIEYPIVYDLKFDIENLWKSLNVKLEEEYDNLLEKIVNYIGIVSKLLKIKIFVFVNLKSFLDNEEINKLYKYVKYKKINIILLENQVQQERLNDEKILIIDKDMCEIY